jgi:hypothetical protein
VFEQTVQRGEEWLKEPAQQQVGDVVAAVGEQGVTAPLSAVALGGAGKVAGAAGEVAAEVAGKAGKVAAQVAEHAPPLARAKKLKPKGPPRAASQAPTSKPPASSAPDASGAYVPSPENTALMERGRAPIGVDGHPVEIHHKGQRPDSELVPMTRTEHRGGENFNKNHSNTGQAPSAIERGTTWRATKRQIWKTHAQKPENQKQKNR